MEKKDAEPTLFEVMRILTAQQRQRLGAIRRKMQETSGVKERLEKEEGNWILNYYKGRKKIAKARLEPQKLEFDRL